MKKRNIQVNFQVTLVSNLSDEELKKNITAAVTKTMMEIEGTEPTGLYLITIDERPERPFPLAPHPTTDLQMDRLREFDKERREDEMWQNQD